MEVHGGVQRNCWDTDTRFTYNIKFVCCCVEKLTARKEIKKMLHKIVIYSHEEQKWVV